MAFPKHVLTSEVDPADRSSWKQFGECRAGEEFVYILRDGSERILYVGITWSPHVRWASHRRKHAWWKDVRSADVWLCTDEDARKVERQLIVTIQPPMNKHQNPRWHSATH